MRRLSPLVAALALLLVACSGSGSDGDGETRLVTPSVGTATPTPASACSPSRAANAGDSPREIAVGGTDRSYLLHIPASYDGQTPLPLTVVFAGFSSDSQSMPGYTHFSDKADEEGFVVAYPAALGTPAGWNIAQSISQADDVAFATAMLDELEADLCIDSSQVFLAGYSDGGGFAQRLACLLPARITALATVAAKYVNCRAAVPWVAFHGMDDAIAPFAGGASSIEPGGGSMLDVRRTLSDWSRELGCDALGQISRPVDGVELTTFVNCLLGDGEVLLYSILDAGHTWPGSLPLPVESVGTTSSQLDATETIWEFFTSRGSTAPDASSR